MAERASKRMRRISTENDESDGADGWNHRGSSRYVADDTASIARAFRQGSRGEYRTTNEQSLPLQALL